VWGYLVPLDDKFSHTLVLKRRTCCPSLFPKGDSSKGNGDGENAKQKGNQHAHDEKANGTPAGGYLIGRHPECGK
jgi:serine/threonine-protein kinase CHEK2